MLHNYTQEEKEFFMEYTSGHSYKEIQQEFIRRFGWEINRNQIKGRISRYKLNTGLNGHFKKGCTPHNKGKKMSPETYKKIQNTMFKKGRISPKSRPVGSERIDSKDGYILVKVAEPNKWQMKHQYVWEQHHGKVRDGYVVIMLDGNRLNTDITNLKCIRRRELLIMNRNGLRGQTAELTDIGTNVAAVMDAVYEARKKTKKKDK